MIPKTIFLKNLGGKTKPFFWGFAPPPIENNLLSLLNIHIIFLVKVMVEFCENKDLIFLLEYFLGTAL